MPDSLQHLQELEIIPVVLSQYVQSGSPIRLVTSGIIFQPNGLLHSYLRMKTNGGRQDGISCLTTLGEPVVRRDVLDSSANRVGQMFSRFRFRPSCGQWKLCKW